MDIPTIKLTQQEFDALPISESTAWAQTRCRAKSATDQWLFIDKDSVPSAAVIEIAEPAAAVRDNVEMFPVTVSMPMTFPTPAVVGEADEPTAPALTDLEKAVASWATLSVIVHEMHKRTAVLVDGVRQLPPKLQSRSAPRVFVFADALEDLAELMDKKVPMAPEAVEWWNSRNEQFTDAAQMRADLRQLDQIVAETEKDAGMEPQPGAEKLRPIEKMGAIAQCLVTALQHQAATIQQLRNRVAAQQKKN